MKVLYTLTDKEKATADSVIAEQTKLHAILEGMIRMIVSQNGIEGNIQYDGKGNIVSTDIPQPPQG